MRKFNYFIFPPSFLLPAILPPLLEGMFQHLTMAMLASANQDGFVGVKHPPKPAGLWHDIFHPCKSALNP
jgi:hypothetical protein